MEEVCMVITDDEEEESRLSVQTMIEEEEDDHNKNTTISSMIVASTCHLPEPTLEGRSNNNFLFLRQGLLKLIEYTFECRYDKRVHEGRIQLLLDSQVVPQLVRDWQSSQEQDLLELETILMGNLLSGNADQVETVTRQTGGGIEIILDHLSRVLLLSGDQTTCLSPPSHRLKEEVCWIVLKLVASARPQQNEEYLEILFDSLRYDLLLQAIVQLASHGNTNNDTVRLQAVGTLLVLFHAGGASHICKLISMGGLVSLSNFITEQQQWKPQPTSTQDDIIIRRSFCLTILSALEKVADLMAERERGGGLGASVAVSFNEDEIAQRKHHS